MPVFHVLVSALLCVVLWYRGRGRAENAPVRVPGIGVTHVRAFLCRRFDFLNWGIQMTGASIFEVDLLKVNVIVLSGESARAAFFNEKHFDLTAGFMVLSGAIPMLKGVTSDLASSRVSLIHKRLAEVQRGGRLAKLIPAILDDCRIMATPWGHTGVVDPFEKIYELTFQATVRSLCCCEIADDPVLVARLKKLYDRLDARTTCATFLLPWFLSPSTISKFWTTKQIYDVISGAIELRADGRTEGDDALQMMLDLDDEKAIIVGFMMGLIIAGARATGTSACWIFTYLGAHQDWRLRVQTELEGLLATHSPEGDETVSLSRRLSTIPLESWECHLPVMDSVIGETLRVAQPHTAMRKNLGSDVQIDGKRIPRGAYVIYPFSDIHLDENIYPDPWVFDPARRRKATSLDYVGWGAGRTPCLGKRLAQTELKLITAMFVLGFQHHLVDSSGSVSPAPRPDWNDTLRCLPSKGKVKARYTRVCDAL